MEIKEEHEISGHDSSASSSDSEIIQQIKPAEIPNLDAKFNPYGNQKVSKKAI